MQIRESRAENKSDLNVAVTTLGQLAVIAASIVDGEYLVVKGALTEIKLDSGVLLKSMSGRYIGPFHRTSL